MSTIRVFIVGGHVTPALATLEEVKRRKLPWEVIFVGRLYAREDDTATSEEYKLVTRENIRFIPLTAGRIPRGYFSPWTIISLLKIPIGFVQALWYCLRYRPKVIISFGGYVAIGVAIVGWILKIPVVTHEQTKIPGFANVVINLFAALTCITYRESRRYFLRKGTVRETGLPLRSGILHPPKQPTFPISKDLPLLYITGGSTGSLSLNTVVFSALPQLLRTFTVIHQTGQRGGDALQAAIRTLPVALRYRYYHAPYFYLPQHSWNLHHAAIVLGRSGANTIAELARLGKVVVLVPLPWSGRGEQLRSAEMLVEAGSGVLIAQEALTPDGLVATIQYVWEHRDEFQGNAHRFSSSVQFVGSVRFVDEIVRIMG